MLSPGHNQNWIYDDVTQILNMAPKPRDTIQGHFSALSYPLEMTFSHSTLGAAPLNNEEAHECEKMATDEVRVFSRAIPIKCFVSHRPPSREGGLVDRTKKKRMNTWRGLGAREGRAAKCESLVKWSFRS